MRGTRSWSLVAIALVVTTNVIAHQPADAGAVAAPAQVSDDVCFDDVSPERLNTLFDTEPAGVVGADYQRALALPDGRVMWTFQDAAVRVGPDEIVIVHNIAVMQDGTCFTVLYSGTRTDPSSMFFPSRTARYERWFWPLDAVAADDGTVNVFAAEMEERGENYLTTTVPVGTWVAVFDPTTHSVLAERRPANSSADLYGWSITSDRSWTYLYAHCHRQFGFDGYALVPAFDRSCSTDITVARVPRGRPLDQPTYWDGANWQGDAGRAASIIDSAGRRINANQFEWTGASFVSVNKEGDWWGDTILLSRSPEPTGPFEIYDAIAAPVKCSECNSFFASWVPERAVGPTGTSYVISLSHNRWDGVVTSLYRPTFHRVDAPPFLPGSSVFSFDVGTDVRAAVLNVVAVEPATAGYLTLYPCDRDVPLASNVNHVNEPLVSNLVIARPDADGRVCVFSRSTTEVVVDLAGTFGNASSFLPVDTPTRLIDTRERPGGQPLAAGEVLRVDVPGGSSSGAAAINVVSVEHAAPGYLTVYPCDRDRPETSNVNYVAEPIVSNLVISETDASGGVCVYTLSETHVVVDLAGSFAAAPGSAVSVGESVRLADTRLGSPTGRLSAGGTLRVEVPFAAHAVDLNVIAVHPAAAGYLTVYPCDIARPGTSNINFVSGPIVSNLVIVSASVDGHVCVYSSAEVDVVVDLSGGLPATSGFDPLDVAVRLVDTRIGLGIDSQLGTGSVWFG